MARSVAQREETQKKIDHLKALSNEQGFIDMTLTEICKQFRMSPPTVYWICDRFKLKLKNGKAMPRRTRITKNTVRALESNQAKIKKAMEEFATNLSGFKWSGKIERSYCRVSRLEKFIKEVV